MASASPSLSRRRITVDAPHAYQSSSDSESKVTDASHAEKSSDWISPAEAYAIAYLLTGTTLAVLGQLVTDQGAVDPSTQLIAWTKYACTFLLSLSIQLLSGKPTGDSSSSSSKSRLLTDSNTRKAAWLTLAVGLLDTISYGVNCLGFALCGSSLSMLVFAACGQVFTAITRRLLLHKTMTAGQTAGVLLVVVGLVVRSTGGGAWKQLTGVGAPHDPELLAGVALVAASALGYSTLGCLYEALSAVRGPAMSHTQVATSTSLIGLLATTVYQLSYTLPRWQVLVADRMAARGLGWVPVVRLYGVFGALFTAHSLVQGVVLQRSGATAVGIISALRASAVAVASGVLFCGPTAPQQCLTPASATSAVVVTAGALTWTLAGPSRKAPQVETWPNDQPQQKEHSSRNLRVDDAGAAGLSAVSSEPSGGNNKFGKDS